MRSRRAWRTDDQGETLIELVVAVAILGVAAVAILSGLMLSIRTSSAHRGEATSGSYVRSWAEAIQTSVDDANQLRTCTQYNATFAALQTENPDLVPLVPSCTATLVSSGLQRLDLSVSASAYGPGSVAESLVVFLRTPCTASGATPCAP